MSEEDDVFDEVFAEEKKEVVEEGFEDEVVSDVPNTQQEQTEESEGVDQPIVEEQPPDPLASLSDEQKAAVEQLRQERLAWEHKYKSDQGRILAAQRLLHEKKEEPRKSPTKEEIVEALADSEKFKAFKDDYGEVAEIVMLAQDEARRQAKQEILAEINPTLEEIRRKQAEREQAEQGAALQREFDRLEAAHPGWDTIATSQDFREWAARQPVAVQQTIVRTTSADEMSAIMTYYKAERRMADIEKASAYAQNKTNARDKALERSRGITPKTAAPSIEGTLPKNDFDAVFTAITK